MTTEHDDGRRPAASGRDTPFEEAAHHGQQHEGARSRACEGQRDSAECVCEPRGRSRYLTLERIAQLRGSDGAIAATLETLADESGRIEVTYEDLAAAAGTSRNTAYRSVQRLKSAGIVAANRRAYRSLAIEFRAAASCDRRGAPHGETDGGEHDRGADGCEHDGDGMGGGEIAGSRSPGRARPMPRTRSQFAMQLPKEVPPLSPPDRAARPRASGDRRVTGSGQALPCAATAAAFFAASSASPR